MARLQNKNSRLKKLLYGAVGLMVLIGACKPQESAPEAQESPLSGSAGSAQAAVTGSMEWHSYDKGLAIGKANGKFIFIEFYADWCPYCKKLDKETLTDPAVQTYLKKDFVPVRVNGESSRQIGFRGAKLTEQELTAVHGVRGYPALFFLEPKGDIIGSVPGFVEAQELKNLMAFVSSKSYKKMKYEQFVKQRK